MTSDDIHRYRILFGQAFFYEDPVRREQTHSTANRGYKSWLVFQGHLIRIGVIGYSVFRYCPQLPPVTQPLSVSTSGSILTRFNRCYNPLAVSATVLHRLWTWVTAWRDRQCFVPGRQTLHKTLRAISGHTFSQREIIRGHAR